MCFAVCKRNFAIQSPTSESLPQIKFCDFDTPDGTNTWRGESENVKLDKERFYGSLEKEIGPREWSCVRDKAWETLQPCWGLRLSHPIHRNPRNSNPRKQGYRKYKCSHSSMVSVTKSVNLILFTVVQRRSIPQDRRASIPKSSRRVGIRQILQWQRFPLPKKVAILVYLYVTYVEWVLLWRRFHASRYINPSIILKLPRDSWTV